MGKMRYTAKDLLRGTLVEESSWYTLRVVGHTETPADTDGSTNFTIEFEILTDGPYKGVPVYRLFNEKAPGFAKDYFKSLGQELNAAGGEFDYGPWMYNKVLDGFIDQRKDNKGNLQNNIAKFRSHVEASV